MLKENMQGDVLAVVGGQFGSEGKGVIVNHIARHFDVHVRVGGPNAGHSFYHRGLIYKMQVIPCGWTNPDAALYLGRGMLVDFKQLMKELDLVYPVDPTILERLRIDPMAGTLTEEHSAEEGGTEGALHSRIGSTGKGVGAARRARMDRDPARSPLAFDIAQRYTLPDGRKATALLAERPVSEELQGLMDRPVVPGILLEGTQGAGLSLTHGPWPYVTSADTNSAQMAADVGIPPRRVNRCMLVVRTFPIRVAGNSGPLPNEISWEELSAEVGKPLVERTTVTNKVRRIGRFDWEVVDLAVRLNAPTSIALTFADYLSPEDEGKTDIRDLSIKTQRFIDAIQKRYNIPVLLVGTGGDGWQVAMNDRLPFWP